MQGTFKAIAMAAALTAVASTGAVAQEKRELGYSFNVALTSDYIFRGFSQTERAPTGQAGVDLTWGIAYVGVWASGVDFGRDPVTNKDAASFEVDVYAGIKPVWMGFNFDFGGIAYLYPGARDKQSAVPPGFLPGETNYFELKAGVSREVVKNLTLSQTFFYSPDYTNSTGRVWTSESGVSYVLPEIGGITPTLSALLGYQQGKAKGVANDYVALIGNGKDNYAYWNAGVTLGWQKFLLDLRYWDTNIKDGPATPTPGFCTNTTTFQCGATFMGTLKFTY